MTDTKTEYYFSKTAIVLTSILLIVISSLFLFIAYFLYNADLKIAMFVCLFILLLFSSTFPTFYTRLSFFLRNTPALILTEDELIDNVNFQTFRWTDIKKVSAASVIVKTRVNYVALSLIEPGKYIKRVRSPYKRLIARLNEKYFGGAFSIPPNIIKCDNVMLLDNLKAYQNEANGQNIR
jgi:hypothetical protein